MKIFKKNNFSNIGLTWVNIIVFIALTLFAGLMETIGMAMLLPILEFIEKDGETAALVGKSNFIHIF